MAYRVGVDIGGTFTDFCVFDDETTQLHALKVLSTPDRPGAEVLDGLRQLQTRFGVAPEHVTYFTHGTTVGVNTVIQRKGIRLCLFVTEGFVDVLEIARLRVPDPYDLLSRRPVPLIPKERVVPIRERVRGDGSIDTALDVGSVELAVERAQSLGAEGVVIALINAYRNPVHEQRAAEIVHRLAPGLAVFESSAVWSIIREYERTITAVVHGYVQPRVSAYLSSLQGALVDAGVTARALVTKSNGGVMSAQTAKTECAHMIMSGTAAGVIGASRVATLAGFADSVSFDVGGTSADVAFIAAGQPRHGVGEMIGEFPIHVPSVSVTSIGAGGGSIAWLDEFGVLNVGPESAGADPGPACYGRGATRATLTDAFALLGYLGRRDIGYDAVRVDVDAARAAIEPLARALGRDTSDTAEAIVRVAVSGMYLETSKLVSSHGADPRDHALIAFGGAGPMVACFLAEELGMRHVVIPTTPGVLSALGGLIADLKNDFIKTVYVDLGDASMPTIQSGYAELRARAVQWLREEQGYLGEIDLVHSADMRYRGQSFEIETTLQADAIDDGDVAALAEAFHAAHETVYNHADRAAPVQVINLRLVAVGRVPKPEFIQTPERMEWAKPAGRIAIHSNGEPIEVPLYVREELQPGHRLDTPSVVAQRDSTACILASFDARVDGYGNLILARRDDLARE